MLCHCKTWTCNFCHGACTFKVGASSWFVNHAYGVFQYLLTSWSLHLWHVFYVTQLRVLVEYFQRPLLLLSILSIGCQLFQVLNYSHHSLYVLYFSPTRHCIGLQPARTHLEDYKYIEEKWKHKVYV